MFTSPYNAIPTDKLTPRHFTTHSTRQFDNYDSTNYFWQLISRKAAANPIIARPNLPTRFIRNNVPHIEFNNLENVRITC